MKISDTEEVSMLKFWIDLTAGKLNSSVPNSLGDRLSRSGAMLFLHHTKPETFTQERLDWIVANLAEYNIGET